jgi:hypothetical protein
LLPDSELKRMQIHSRVVLKLPEFTTRLLRLERSLLTLQRSRISKNFQLTTLIPIRQLIQMVERRLND